MMRVPCTSVCSYSGRPSHSGARSGSAQMRTASSISRSPRVGLVQDVEDRVVGELHRRVVPHAGHLALALADARVLGLADRPHAPRAVARAPPAVGRDRDALAAHLERAAPAARLREAHRVEQHAAVLADVLARLLERGDRAVPGEVAGDPVLGFGSSDEAHARRAASPPRRGTARRSCPCGRRARATRAPRGGARRARTHANASCTPRFGYWPSPITMNSSSLEPCRLK